MQYRAIRVAANAADHPRRCDLGSDLVAALAAALAEDAPTFFVLSKRDAGAVVACHAMVVDRGHKHPKAAPSVGMLGQSRIPLRRVGYKSTRRLLNGVRSVLEGAVKRGERNIYIFVVADELFDDLWAKSSSMPTPAPRPGTPPTPPTNPPSPPSTQREPPKPAWAGTGRRVTDGLAKRYVGESVPIRLVRREIAKMAEDARPVLIDGEPGTGKALVARLIHDTGLRRAEPFVEIPCRQASADTVELDPFGSTTRGNRPSLPWEQLLQLARGGTLFLRDVEFLPPLLQGRLIELITSQRDGLGPNVRIVAAATLGPGRRPLQSSFVPGLIEQFDCQLRTPGLSEINEDVPRIASFLWARAVFPLGLALPPDVLGFLMERRWPGNADELERLLWILFARHHRCDLAGVREAAGELATKMAYTGHEPPSVRGKTPASQQGWDIHYYDHLVEVGKAFRSFWVAIEPIRHYHLHQPLSAATIETMQTGTGTALKWLAELCLTLLHFPTPEIQDAVLRLKGEMMEIRTRLVQDPAALATSWSKQSEALYDLTIRQLFEARDSVIGGGPTWHPVQLDPTTTPAAPISK